MAKRIPLSQRLLPNYTRGEELMNMITHIVGGGCQDGYLNRLTAAATGLPVWAGPVEGTAIGNLVIQMIRGGEFADLAAARSCIRESFDIKEVLPQ